jgi:ferredoxin
MRNARVKKGENQRMAYMITEACVMCGNCEQHCPNEAISEGEDTNIVDPERCTECVGTYEVSKCSVICSQEACVPDPNYEESREQLLEKWKKLHPRETPVNV